MNYMIQKIMHTLLLHRPGAGAAIAGACLALSSQGAPLQIVTTTSDLASIADAVAGEHADVTSIATGKEDPHFLQAKPSFIMQARKADLWIRVGMELEIGWESPILNGARNPQIKDGAKGHLDASANVLRLGVPNQRVTRAMGDVHPSGNPHYWLDPLNGRIVAETIAERLVALRPEHADLFRRNLATFQKKLDERMFGKELVAEVGGDNLWALSVNGKLDRHLATRDLSNKLGGWYGMLRPHQGRRVLIYHRSWNYFTERFGLAIAGELEPKPGVPPSGSHLAKMVKIAEADDVALILVEPYYNRKAADFVAKRSDAQVVQVPISVGGSAAASDYLKMLNLIVTGVSQALQEN